MKLLSLSLLAGLSAIAFSQSNAITLGEAQPVDVRVSSLFWQQDGHAFLYQKQEEKGVGVGAFALGKYEGKTLIHAGKQDRIEWYWLGTTNTALVVVRSRTADVAMPIMIQMYTVDADAQTAKLSFKESFEEKSQPRVQVDASPSLKHAIITLRHSGEPRHLVVSSVSGEIIKALDIDRAEKEGLSGPSWSLDGTAIYSNAQSNGSTAVRLTREFATLNTTSNGGSTGADTTEDIKEVFITNVKADGTATATTNGNLTLSFRILPPTPPVNTPVFEVMPSNGVIRPIRFRGPWDYPAKAFVPFIPRSQSIVLQYEKSNAQDNSIWLKRGADKSAPSAFLGVHVSQAFVSPGQNAVAYIIDGALFWRSIK